MLDRSYIFFMGIPLKLNDECTDDFLKCSLRLNKFEIRLLIELSKYSMFNGSGYKFLTSIYDVNKLHRLLHELYCLMLNRLHHSIWTGNIFSDSYISIERNVTWISNKLMCENSPVSWLCQRIFPSSTAFQIYFPECMKNCSTHFNKFSMFWAGDWTISE